MGISHRRDDIRTRTAYTERDHEAKADAVATIQTFNSRLAAGRARLVLAHHRTGMQMDRAELTSKVEAIFHEVLDDDSIRLRDDITARDVKGWDSVANVRLILSIEEAFAFRFDMGEISEMRKVGDLLDAIQTRIG